MSISFILFKMLNSMANSATEIGDRIDSLTEWRDGIEAVLPVDPTASEVITWINAVTLQTRQEFSAVHNAAGSVSGMKADRVYATLLEDSDAFDDAIDALTTYFVAEISARATIEEVVAATADKAPCLPCEKKKKALTEPLPVPAIE